MEKLNLNVEALRSLHRFYDALQSAIASIESEKISVSPVPEATDAIGRHWYGARCRVKCLRSGATFYIHTGLIYREITRQGLMVEADQKNNGGCYAAVCANIKKSEKYDIYHEEPEYFKLFMPQSAFDTLPGQKLGEQVLILRKFLTACFEAIADAAYEEGFSFTMQNLDDARNLAYAFKDALESAQTETSKTEINLADKDNFGRYAEGYRYWLSDAGDQIRLYAYFGAIYSYQKDPAGIFAEIDWLSNQTHFDRAFANMRPSHDYDLSVREPKFIKLFMPSEIVARFNASEPKAQRDILLHFLKTCDDALVNAARA